jgi:hypothetical protein
MNVELLKIAASLGGFAGLVCLIVLYAYREREKDFRAEMKEVREMLVNIVKSNTAALTESCNSNEALATQIERIVERLDRGLEPKRRN